MIENPIIKWIGLVSISIVGIYSFVLLGEEKYLSAVLTALIVVVIKILASKIDNDLIKNRKTKEEEEQAIKIEILRKEQAIQDEIYRKEQAKYEEQERIRKQRELEIWNRKSPIEKARIKFKEIDDSIDNDNWWLADSIFKEWEKEFQTYLNKDDIRSAKDKIFYLRLNIQQQKQRQREIKEEREQQRERDYDNERIRREQEKDNKKWYCPKCGRVVPGRNSPTDRNCIGGKSHEWQLRS